ncbi:MAG: DUF4249 domain-containing protein [Bacteroidia bacterium]|nr:DUF4249 domain-containing protein [Bacteroidia bacterium]MCF8426351.1 DUF4249 domain-containing protein [Bacteroidia bacterium]MCF8445750.1 DUF4249 domain-containing protein [Bacteroidia bacterium]
MKKILYFSILLTLAITSCKEKIDVQVADASPIVVVEAEITTEKDSSYVKLSLSSNYFNTLEIPFIKSANVSVNGVPFLFDPSLNLYKPFSGYVGKTDSTYNLLVNYDGKDYTSSAKLERMFRVDSFYQTWKDAEGFLEAGYSVSYAGFDNRPQTKYTYFVNGYFDTIVQRDSFDGNIILFDNAFTPVNEPYQFEIPFARFNSGDEYIAIFRSVDKNMNDFLIAYSNQNPDIPGPFQVPPANLPTNITGGALGYFATYDISRWRYKVK